MIPAERPPEARPSGPATAAAPDARSPQSGGSTAEGPVGLDIGRPQSARSAPRDPVRSTSPFGKGDGSASNFSTRSLGKAPESPHDSRPAPIGSNPLSLGVRNGPGTGPGRPGSPGPRDGHPVGRHSGDADAAAGGDGGRAEPVGPREANGTETDTGSGQGTPDNAVSPGQGTVAAHASTRHEGRGPDRTTSAGPGDSQATAAREPGTAGAEGGDFIDLGAAAGIGAMAGAGFVWRLDRSRREQNHRRPKGGLIGRNRPEVEVAERCVRAIAREDTMRWVDYGVRYLSGLVERVALDNQAPVPSLVLVRVGGCGLEIVLSPRASGSLGWFSPTGDGTSLVLDADITLEELKTLGADRWAVWPALVSLGASEGDVLLLNLEHAGSLSVEGPDDKVRGVLGQLVLELVSQPWSDEMLAGVYALGDVPLDRRLPGVNRVPVSEAEELAEKFGRISRSHQDLAGPFALAGLRSLACEALPNIAVAFPATPARVLEGLVQAAVPDQSGLAVVGAGPYRGARWKLSLANSGDGLLQGELSERPVSFELTVKCSQQDVVLLSEGLGAASDPYAATGTSGPTQMIEPSDDGVDIRSNGSHFDLVHEFVDKGNRNDAQPRIPSPGKAALPQPGGVEVCVLGPVDIAGGEMHTLEPSRRMAVLALLAYMASHRRPLRADELASALWPLDASKDSMGGPQRKTIMNLISRARGVLGYGAEGAERLAYSPQGYRLSPEVTSDLERFEKHLVVARQQRAPEAIGTLRAALDLVRGEPFGGVMSSQFFEWVASEHLDLTIVARVVDAAQDLGEYALDDGDYETVTWAVEKGLQLEPTREELFRLWMHALGRTGRPAKVDDVYRRLTAVLRQRLSALHEPQPDTREVWRRYTQADAGRAGER